MPGPPRIGRLTGLLCLLALFVGCLSTAHEKEAGARAAEQVESSMGLLDDPYDSVRFVASLALRKRAGYANFDYDFVGTRAMRRSAVERARGVDRTFAVSAASDRSVILLDESGKLDTERFDGLLLQRDNRAVDIRE